MRQAPAEQFGIACRQQEPRTGKRTEVGIRLEVAHEKAAPGRDPRNFPSYPIRCRVNYTGNHDGTGFTKDLSIGGCLLDTDTHLDVDSDLTSP